MPDLTTPHSSGDDVLPTTDAPPVLTSEAQALEVALELAGLLQTGAVQRDRERIKPLVELEAIARSGLLGIAVPPAHGGLGASRGTIIEVVRRIARQDPAIAQILHPHFGLQAGPLAADAAGPLASALFPEILRTGARIGNAYSERGGKTAFDLETVAEPLPDGRWRLNGTKHYATGVLGSRWFIAGAKRGSLDGHAVTAFVPTDTPGVELRLEEWNSFGQRTTFSGTVVLRDVVVDGSFVLDGGPPVAVADLPPTINQAYLQGLHAAIDVGIAHSALAEGRAFVLEKGRVRPEAGVDRLADEPHVQRRFGELLARLHALEALLERAGKAIDAAAQAPALTDENTAAASLAVAEVKALSQDFGLEIATSVFELAGASSTDEAVGLDRHWRNLRAHSLHDPSRFKYVALGNHLLNGVNPPRDQLL